MPKRVPIERPAAENVRGLIVDHLKYLAKRERLIFEDITTARFIELEKLVQSVSNGDDVELSGMDLPGSLNITDTARVKLTGDRIIEF